ncbi:MAG: ATP-binding protein [Pseudomonadota bacterium]
MKHPSDIALFDAHGAALFRGQRTLRRRRRILDVFIVAFIVGAFAILASSIEHVSQDATTINQAGRQRALAQRVGLLAARLPKQRDAVSAQSTVRAIATAHKLLIDTHRQLSRPQQHDYPSEIQEALAEAYFASDALDDRTRDFSDLVQKLLDPPSAMDLEPLVDEIVFLAAGSIEDPSSLLYAQNRVVDLYEIGYEQKLTRFHWQLRLCAITIFLLVGIGSVLVFLPAIRSVETQALRNERERRRLIETAAHGLGRLGQSIDTLTRHMRSIAHEHPEVMTLVESVETLDSRAKDLKGLIGTDREYRPDDQFSVTKLVDEVLAEPKVRNEADGLQIDVHIPEDREIRNDRILLTQSLVHLVTNAIRFRDPAELVPMINIYVEFKAEHCVITVRDNGIGIPPTVQSTLFQAKAGADGFSGVGLSIVQQNIRQCGGDVAYTPVIGGSSFAIRIPTNRKRPADDPTRTMREALA